MGRCWCVSSWIGHSIHQTSKINVNHLKIDSKLLLIMFFFKIGYCRPVYLLVVMNRMLKYWWHAVTSLQCNFFLFGLNFNFEMKNWLIFEKKVHTITESWQKRHWKSAVAHCFNWNGYCWRVVTWSFEWYELNKIKKINFKFCCFFLNRLFGCDCWMSTRWFEYE